MPDVLPGYISRSVPVPEAKRVPWYKSTFPTYAGIFLFVGFFLPLPEPTLTYAGLSVCLLGLAVAGLLCFALYYYVPAMLGMKTGQSLYVVGSSTFGAAGGYFIPGLLMGVLQVGWVAVVAAVATGFILKGLKLSSFWFSTALIVVWVYSLAWIAIKGIHYVSRAAKVLNWIPLFMVIVVFWANRGGIASYRAPHPDPLAGFFNAITIVIGFFATAGAAGADFGMNNRHRSDIVLGGLCGIVGGVLVAGGLPILSVAGYLGRHAGPATYDYTAAIASVGALAPAVFFLFAAACLVPTCFSSFIASNSFSIMLPRIPRAVSTIAAVTVSALLAITGIADHLAGFFGIVGASFGPICGAMAADYLNQGKRWTGPRKGMNWPGYIAWALGFLVGIPDHLPGLPASFVKADNPAVLYSFGTGFVVYLLLARLGMESPVLASGQRERN